MEINKLQLEISENCSEENKEIISKYWAYNSDYEFSVMPRKIMREYSLSQSELSKIVSRNSCLNFYLPCKCCNSFEFNTSMSQTSFKQTILTFRRKKSNYKCQHCENLEWKQMQIQHKKVEEERERIEQEEEQRLIQAHNKAIDDKAWLKLSPFENAVLKHAIQLTDFNELKRYYYSKGKSSYSMMFSALRILAAENLLYINYEWGSNRIKNYSILERLQNEYEFTSPSENISKNKSEVIFNNETNEIKFKLFIDKNQHHPDSPLYAGTVTFNEKIVIESGTEYIYGFWIRSNDDLYLTMTPLDNMNKLPNQRPISSLPILLRKGLEDFLNNMGRNV